jgi:ABC-type transporter Mla MlaB component
MVVLRISVEKADDAVTMKLEGKVVGPWAEECDRVWHATQKNLGSAKLRLDLRGVTFVDERGIALLRSIYRKSSAEVLAESPLTKYFAVRITEETEEKEVGGI